ncbi:Gfo/Idh/MocA family protein [Tautonia marina]|uniref:Gfo/Idh/MocA family protein n=1 Tax=Tautonia marina TaxID=2653855 RepID=UPI0012613A06|nr:Gfo/Idh/MocA family oxidoreductase [Tautonia marina]
MKRRRFFQATAAGLALSTAPGFAEAAAAMQGKRVGLIGTGWYGKVDLFRLLQVAPVEVAALCDVDAKMLAEAAEMTAKRQPSGKVPRTYADYREMLDENDLDIVLIATPDHWHALPMIAAVERGADVYVQKPISVDVAEGKAMLDAARKHGRVVQVGTQRRSTPHLIEARDRIVREGLLGTIGHVEVYCYYHMRNRSQAADTAPPEHLDWEMWTGPAPMRPFNPIAHPRGWRAFTEYGNGIMGDMCIHMLDAVRWMLDLGWPKRIASTGGIFIDPASRANIPDTQTATFEFDEFPVVWQHRSWGHPVDPDYPWGATIYGDKGTLKLSVHRYDFTPLGNGQPIHGDVLYELDEYPEDRTEKDLEQHVAPAVRRHMLDFLSAIESRGKPVADIEQGHISSASCILANLAMDLGRTLTWDAELGQVVGDDEANRRLARPYREPWTHPGKHLL